MVKKVSIIIPPQRGKLCCKPNNSRLELTLGFWSTIHIRRLLLFPDIIRLPN